MAESGVLEMRLASSRKEGIPKTYVHQLIEWEEARVTELLKQEQVQAQSLLDSAVSAWSTRGQHVHSASHRCVLSAHRLKPSAQPRQRSPNLWQPPIRSWAMPTPR